ncbi:MAG: CRISPR-associated endoribonuclease Cas6 [Acidobacteriota bacterium]
MRVRLKLKALGVGARLPLNSNHQAASLIYKIVGQSSSAFATELHEAGFMAENGRKFKLFAFSRLNPLHRRRVGDELHLQSPEVEWTVSSPVAAFIEHFVSGLFQSARFKIARTEFVLAEAESLPEPRFTERLKMRALSPITESLRDAEGRVRFLTIEENWSEVMQRNLLRKYEALHGRAPEDRRFRWTWDGEYVKEQMRRGKRVSSLVEINGEGREAIKVRGWLAPFSVEGSLELIKLGYEAGFGSRNSMGFGLAEVCP